MSFRPGLLKGRFQITTQEKFWEKDFNYREQWEILLARSKEQTAVLVAEHGIDPERALADIVDTCWGERLGRRFAAMPVEQRREIIVQRWLDDGNPRDLPSLVSAAKA